MEAGKVRALFGYIDGNEQVELNIAPYYGVIKATNLTFPSPNMKQMEIIALFKHQALKQGTHLMTMARPANSKGYSSRTPIQRDHKEDCRIPPLEYHWNIKALLRLPNDVAGAERCDEGIQQEEHHSRGNFH
jgi:hypothetical protein